ncbi:hypothetical protein [Hymenobacter metallicola]|uniref:Uncharacterized protein n=1 Tax=Hymenobacter metallicola TaxID=2563114 RepID=A0A4Z0QG70_9BACT|nr:hypothetical protein [Hymenobacter metallicola]TGE28735.1 hypothetical protein E5K02_04520 [Hymenobacter metallicola]
MKPEIRQQILRLGGRVTAPPVATLPEFLQATTFAHPLYPRRYAEEVLGLDVFYDQNRDLYAANPAAFDEALLLHFFADHELPYGQDFFRNFRFTPFTPDTPDYGELEDLVSPADLHSVVAGTDPLEFICICYSYGFPDHYFVCLSDPAPDNPTVYGTDHEVFFQEITAVGTLENFFSRYLSKEEFLAIAQQHFAARNAAE